jgi:hypothetical protein
MIISILTYRFTELYITKPNMMKLPNSTMSTDNKTHTKTILVTGVIILLLQLLFHLTVDVGF